jgi:hypothetical protein
VIVSFAFLREGTSDDGLIPHLRELVVRAGAHEAGGASRDYRGSVQDKLSELLSEKSPLDLIFVHRDADAPDPSSRRAEIQAAVRATKCSIPCIPVVPVQELEAWLLVSEAEIREVAGRPSGRKPLNLPALKHLEEHTDPKSTLKRVLLDAAEHRGRHKARESKRFETRRRTLLDRLDLDGPVTRLPAWQQLVRDINETIASRNAGDGKKYGDIM